MNGDSMDAPRSLSYPAAEYATVLNALHGATGNAELVGLHAHTTRDSTDWTNAYFDAVACLAHIVGFHTQQIASESYIGTAVERLSVRHLARLVAYELGAGKSADAWVEFGLDTDGLDADAVVPLRAGIAIDSIPGPGEVLMHFETTEDLVARPGWSELRARTSTTPSLEAVAGRSSVDFAGSNLRLQPGAVLVFELENGRRKHSPAMSVTSDTETNRTTVTIGSASTRTMAWGRRVQLRIATATRRIARVAPMTADYVDAQFADSTWKQADVAASFGDSRRRANFTTYLQARAPAVSQAGVSVYRQRSGIFGARAPSDRPDNGAARPAGAMVGSVVDVTDDGVWLPLDTKYSGVGPGSVVLVSTPDQASRFYVVVATDEVIKDKWGITASVTRLRLQTEGQIWLLIARDLLTTTVFLQLDPLRIATDVIDDPVAGTLLDLDHLDLDVTIGQRLVVRGDRVDLPGVDSTQLRRVGDLHTVDGRTVITLDSPLEHALVRASVRVNANVVAVNHGKTVAHPIGSGNGAIGFQEFLLPDGPLTYGRADTPSGVRAALEVRVDGVRWSEIDSLFTAKPDDAIYTLVRHGDGATSVRFGDGRSGRRLPTGLENVHASYRVGVGVDGLVAAGQLSLLATKPAGVQSVTNPLAATDAAEPDSLEMARTAAPASVQTLGRVVSLRDHQAFALEYAGITAALATWVWDGRRRAVVVTVAGGEGEIFEPGHDKLTALQAALVAAGDRSVPVTVVGYRPAMVVLEASIALGASHESDVVEAAVRQVLLDRFGWQSRPIGGHLVSSEVVAAMHGVAGVQMVDLNVFDRTTHVPPTRQKYISAHGPTSGQRFRSIDEVQGAEVVALDPQRVQIGVQP